MKPLADFALPPRCPICGVTVEQDNRFCIDCWHQLNFLAEPWCAACGLPFAFEHAADSRCAACLVQPPVHDGVRAVVQYDERSALIAMRLKYGNRLGLADLIAEQLQKFIENGAEDAILVPVPLHRWRLWRRGFNQSVLIGRTLARITGLEMNCGLIFRNRITPPLRGMSPRQRRKTVDAAFALRPAASASLSGRTVLLIDDVYTSGATSNACARLLKRAGAARVYVFCWARVIREAEPGQFSQQAAIA
ncbi:ComF family protein [Parasphingorhabdus sp.]|uniref:ComF family protein n=1 Tax=Parasphingorhabdus sp. TaxID=2709688 RepID=UPI003001EC49